MTFRLERSRRARRDLVTIARFLTRSYYLQFGDSFAEAKERVSTRMGRIDEAMMALSKAPYQGTLRPKLMAGLRHVTKDRAVFYFIVDDDARVVRVLAVFFGGQDHQNIMLRRLLERD